MINTINNIPKAIDTAITTIINKLEFFLCFSDSFLYKVTLFSNNCISLFLLIIVEFNLHIVCSLLSIFVFKNSIRYLLYVPSLKHFFLL